MKKIFNIKTISSIIPILGIVLLLLISPCKVRNFIQSELGLPLTEVANKSKTTINNASCSNLEISEYSLINSNLKNQNLPILGESVVNSTFNTIASANQTTSDYKKRSQFASTVPLYILHKNFQTYL